MWELDYKESWVPKNWCFWTVVLEKTWESLRLQRDQISQSSRKSVLNIHLKDRFWSWNSHTLACDVKNYLIGKDPDSGKDWRQEKGMTEGKMVGWHHWLSRHEFEQAPGDGEGQGSLACWSPWGCKESDTTDWLNNNRAPAGCALMNPLYFHQAIHAQISNRSVLHSAMPCLH